ncbi:hypothetical protein ABPG72_001466 [Tetrahymena utriculariae]
MSYNIVQQEFENNPEFLNQRITNMSLLLPKDILIKVCQYIEKIISYNQQPSLKLNSISIKNNVSELIETTQKNLIQINNNIGSGLYEQQQNKDLNCSLLQAEKVINMLNGQIDQVDFYQQIENLNKTIEQIQTSFNNQNFEPIATKIEENNKEIQLLGQQIQSQENQKSVSSRSYQDSSNNNQQFQQEKMFQDLTKQKVASNIFAQQLGYKKPEKYYYIIIYNKDFDSITLNTVNQNLKDQIVQKIEIRSSYLSFDSKVELKKLFETLTKYLNDQKQQNGFRFLILTDVDVNKDKKTNQIFKFVAEVKQLKQEKTLLTIYQVKNQLKQVLDEIQNMKQAHIKAKSLTIFDIINQTSSQNQIQVLDQYKIIQQNYLQNLLQNTVNTFQQINIKDQEIEQNIQQDEQQVYQSKQQRELENQAQEQLKILKQELQLIEKKFVKLKENQSNLLKKRQDQDLKQELEIISNQNMLKIENQETQNRLNIIRQDANQIKKFKTKMSFTKGRQLHKYLVDLEESLFILQISQFQSQNVILFVQYAFNKKIPLNTQESIYKQIFQHMFRTQLNNQDEDFQKFLNLNTLIQAQNANQLFSLYRYSSQNLEQPLQNILQDCQVLKQQIQKTLQNTNKNCFEQINIISSILCPIKLISS